MASKEGTLELIPGDSMDADFAEYQVVKLLVSDLHPDVTIKIVEGYFESRMVEVVSVSLPSERKCIVSVTKLKNVEKFCARNHKIKKCPVKIELLPEEVNDPYTIEVVYPLDTFDHRFDEDLLEAYFTGPASGEREDDEDKSIERIRIIEPGRCHIKFELSEDAACVLAKKTHTFMKKELTVSPVKSSLRRDDLVTPPTNPRRDGMKPIKEKSSMDEKFERNKLIIRNIPEDVGDKYFNFFLGRALDFKSEHNWYTFELSKTTALLTFAKAYSIEELNTFCEMISSKQMKGQVLLVELCRTNCTVLIAEITKESFASQDGLRMYFGNKRSGGGRDQVEDVMMLGRKKAKVTFKSSQTVASVLSKDHSTLGPNVKMVACSPLDDDVEGNSAYDEGVDDHSLSLPSTGKRNSPPMSFHTENIAAKRFTLDLLVAKYLSHNRDILDGIAREVQATATVVDWSSGIIELLLKNTDASPDDLESTVTQFKSLLSSTVCRANIHYPPEASTEASKAIVNFSSQNNLPVNFTKDNCITIAGRVNQIRDLENTVHNLCDRIVPAPDLISLSHEDFIYISKYAIKEATKAHPNVKIKMDGAANVMSLSGSRHDVSRFKESLNDFTSHATIPVQVTKLAVKFLKDGKGAGILQTLIKRDSVIPFFSKDLFAGYSLLLLCPHADAQYAENISATISVTIMEKDFKFPQYFFTDVADSPRFNNFKQKMSNKYAFHCAVEGNTVFKLVCREEIQQQLCDSFRKFVAEECSTTIIETMPVKRGIWRLFNSSMEKKWNKLEAEMKESDLKVLSKSKPTASKPFLKIKGDRNVLAKMKEKFMELQKSVHELKFTVARPGIVQHFYKDPHGRVSLQGVETAAKVCIELEVQQEDDSEADATPTSSSFKKMCTAKTQGITVNLYVGDITQFNRAEVIVNAANEDLQHSAGVAGAIVDRGGPVILKDSQDYVNKKGKVPTGSAVIFHRVGNLPPPYQAIVHAVGPRWFVGDSKDRNIALLRKAVKNSLKQAKSFNSIAIPAISSGVFGFPIDIAANSLVQGVIEFMTNNSDCNLSNINFVIFDDKLAAFKKAIKEHLQNVHMFDEVAPQPYAFTKTTPTVSQLTQSNFALPKVKTSSATPIPMSQLRKKKISKKPISSARSSRPSDASDANRCSFALPNGIHLHVIQGDITDERTDVIVNTTNPDLKLIGGGVSGALLKKGGPGLQDACDRTKASNMKAEGKVVETRCEGIGQLRCKSIFHIVFEGKEQRKLVKTILACLDRAEKMKYASIAIPAIGTGAVAYPSASAAEGIVKALKQFTQRKPNHVKEIRMVIFMPNMFKEFTDAFKKIKDKNGPEGILNYIYHKGSQLLNSFLNPSSDESDEDKMEWTPTTYEDTDEHSDSDDEEKEDNDFEHIGMPMDKDVLSSISLDAEITMYIYGESEQAARRAEKNLKSIIDTLIVDEEVVDPNICELSSAAIGDLNEFSHQQNVDIDIDNDPALHTIKLYGCKNDVLKVKDKVRDALSHVHQFKAKKEVASAVSKHFKWVRQLSDDKEDDYDEVLSLEIEQAFQKKKTSYHYSGDIERFTIDFLKMEETHLDSREKVKVSRVIDFTEEEKPYDWVPMPKESNGREVTVHLVILQQSDAEYKAALYYFNVTMKSSYTQIVSIQRIQNPVLYGQYMARKKEMKKRNPPNCQYERWLFHGTKPAVIDAINTQGLNRSFKGATMYGQGVYFARDASYSHKYSQPDPFNHRHMYLARVLTGEFAVGNQAMLIPPPKNNQQNQHILFDSTVNNTADPSIFVVYTDSQAYAAYLITYIG